MNKVTSSQQFSSSNFEVYVDDSLHAMISKTTMIAMQSYKLEKEGAKMMYNIELYYPTKTILFEYEDEQLWLDILKELNKYL
jgi:hypothetical protein